MSSDYLNNRHYDPTTGVFLSVDPLVVTTAEPYIYGSTNPVTLSDPSGLETCGYKPGPSGGQQHGCWDDYEQYVNQRETGSAWENNPAVDWSAPRPPRRNPPAQRPPLADAAALWSEVLLGFDDGADGGGSAVCAQAGGAAGITGSGSSCILADTDGLGALTTLEVGAAVGAPSLSGSAGWLITNADAAELVGWSICGNATAGIATGSLCGGVKPISGSDEWGYTGAWTLYRGVSSPAFEGGHTYAYTWYDSWVKWPW